MKDERQDLTQRVRIGFTGLASVFLLVMLGAIFVQFVHDGEASRPPEPIAANAAAPANAVDATPKEPLAELGVVPGNAPTDSAAASAAAQAGR
jgi:Na+-transporting methylmalonyl-CoA/oxaloacetate decarboxylase gamma subunit